MEECPSCLLERYLALMSPPDPAEAAVSSIVTQHADRLRAAGLPRNVHASVLPPLRQAVPAALEAAREGERPRGAIEDSAEAAVLAILETYSYDSEERLDALEARVDAKMREAGLEYMCRYDSPFMLNQNDSANNLIHRISEFILEENGHVVADLPRLVTTECERRSRCLRAALTAIEEYAAVLVEAART